MSPAITGLAAGDAAVGFDPNGRRDLAMLVHARAVSSIFRAHESGRPILADQNAELQRSRRVLDRFDQNASRDIERAYKADPPLAHQTAGGNIQRAVRAMQLETELRVSAPARADAFIERWQKLDVHRLGAYQSGDMDAMRRVRGAMGAMAKSLERDPQLESLLAARKQQLGIGVEIGRGLGRDLATSIGFDMGRGRGLGV